MRISALDDLTVHFENEPHHAVRSRVLRPEIHHEVPDARWALERAVRRRARTAYWFRPPAWLFRHREGSCPSPPRATGNRSFGTLAASAPAPRSRASVTRRSTS